MTITKVLPNPILPQVSPRDINGVIQTYAVTTRTLGDIIREHARAINQIIDWTTAIDSSWSSWTPVVTASSGTITTLGAVNGWYKLLNAATAAISCQIKIVTNGTGANGIIISGIPFTLTRPQYGGGREIFNLGYTLHWTINTVNSSDLLDYANLYPGADGREFMLSAVIQL